MEWPIIQDCLICRQTSATLICAYCHDDLTLFQPSTDKNLLLWPPAARGLSKVDFDYLYALADYQWPLSHLLSSLKFSAKLPHAKALAQLFVSVNIEQHIPRPEVLIPMPLHPNRFLARKFNQSLEICKHISAMSNIPANYSTLRRRKATSPQTELSAAQRRQNLLHAFEVPPAEVNKLNTYRHVALFDDVVTTGATANAAYRCLQQAAPDLRIDIWTICLTLQH